MRPLYGIVGDPYATTRRFSEMAFSKTEMAFPGSENVVLRKCRSPFSRMAFPVLVFENGVFILGNVALILENCVSVSENGVSEFFRRLFPFLRMAFSISALVVSAGEKVISNLPCAVRGGWVCCFGVLRLAAVPARGTTPPHGGQHSKGRLAMATTTARKGTARKGTTPATPARKGKGGTTPASKQAPVGTPRMAGKQRQQAAAMVVRLRHGKGGTQANPKGLAWRAIAQQLPGGPYSPRTARALYNEMLGAGAHHGLLPGKGGRRPVAPAPKGKGTAAKRSTASKGSSKQAAPAAKRTARKGSAASSKR